MEHLSANVLDTSVWHLIATILIKSIKGKFLNAKLEGPNKHISQVDHFQDGAASPETRYK